MLTYLNLIDLLFPTLCLVGIWRYRVGENRCLASNSTVLVVRFLRHAFRVRALTRRVPVCDLVHPVGHHRHHLDPCARCRHYILKRQPGGHDLSRLCQLVGAKHRPHRRQRCSDRPSVFWHGPWLCDTASHGPGQGRRCVERAFHPTSSLVLSTHAAAQALGAAEAARLCKRQRAFFFSSFCCLSFFVPFMR